MLGAPPGDQAVHRHLPLLTNAVAASHGLQVILWVPVAIIDDDGIGRGQGDALAAGTGGQQEHKGSVTCLRATGWTGLLAGLPISNGRCLLLLPRC